jgi:hypothetical protein
VKQVFCSPFSPNSSQIGLGLRRAGAASDGCYWGIGLWEGGTNLIHSGGGKDTLQMFFVGSSEQISIYSVLACQLVRFT